LSLVYRLLSYKASIIYQYSLSIYGIVLLLSHMFTFETHLHHQLMSQHWSFHIYALHIHAHIRKAVGILNHHWVLLLREGRKS